MLEDRRLVIFKTLAECGNFTAAARQLGITQPAVSQNISEIEKALGVKLFTRTTNQVSLTSDGRTFLGYVNQILHWYKVAEEAFAPANPLDANSGALFSNSGASLRKQPGTPARITLEDGRQIQIWTSGNDIHIEGL